MASKLSKFQLEFMLGTMNPYSKLNFSIRKENSENIQKIIKEGESEVSKPKPETIKKNKTYERIMKEGIKK